MMKDAKARTTGAALLLLAAGATADPIKCAVAAAATLLPPVPIPAPPQPPLSVAAAAARAGRAVSAPPAHQSHPSVDATVAATSRMSLVRPSEGAPSGCKPSTNLTPLPRPSVTAVVANLSSAITIAEPAEPAGALPFSVSAAMPEMSFANATVDANATDVDAPAAECPPPGLEPLPGSELNLDTWAAAPWYPMWQMPLAYQNADQLYCVRAAYLLEDERTVRVFNT